jgi:predicted phage-related endonuclease
MNIEITDVTTHNVVQGSAEWHALRAEADGTASEAPAVMGASSKLTRTQLLTAKATGITKEVSDYVQRFLFDKGHELEKSYLPHAEARIEDELFPVTVTAIVNGIRLLASCDGATMGGDSLYEHKMLNAALIDYINVNGEPDMERVWQLEQQLLVTGAERVLVAVGDGTKEGTTTCWYESQPQRRKELILGWKVFMEDLAAWTPDQAVELPKVVAAPVEKLPALIVNVSGEVTVGGNIAQWKAVAQLWLENAPKATELESDQDFADADAFAKECTEVEARLELVKSQALAQSKPLEELVITLDQIREQIRAARIGNERAVKYRKDNIKATEITKAQADLTTYVEGMNRGFGQRLMPVITADFAGAAKNKRTMDSLRNAVGTELARVKRLATEASITIAANLKAISEAGPDAAGLFPDLSQVCTKAADDFAAALQVRLDKHRASLKAAADKAIQDAADKAEKEAADKAAADAARAAEPPAEQPVIRVEQPVAETRPVGAVGSGFRKRSETVAAATELAYEATSAATVDRRENDVVTTDAHHYQPFDLDAMVDDFMAGNHFPPMVRAAVRTAILDWEAFKTGARMAA